MDLMQELGSKTRQLDLSLRNLHSAGVKFAQAEREYKVLLAQECLKLRDGGMPIGLIEKVCYGLPAVAEKRFERDVAESLYKTNAEAINALKLQLRLLEGQINREWNQS